MNSYITGATVKKLREERGMTQAQLGHMLGVSAQAVSKWERDKSLPDISLLPALAEALRVSVSELLSGRQITNKNRSANMLYSKFYVCPVCRNVLYALGEASLNCCGIALPPLDADETDPEHNIVLEHVEDEIFVSADHPMTKEHYISFMAHISSDRLQMIKLYPEGNCEGRFKLRGKGFIYIYCTKHGLFKTPVK